MFARRLVTIGLLAATCLSGSLVAAQQVTREAVPGIANVARLETTVACAGAIASPDAVSRIKEMGFVSIVNLRESTEPGANVEQERAAAEAAGLKYFHVPVNSGSPDPKAADQFLAAITTPGVEPAFIHCASGNRAAAMWLIKRLVVDRWEVDRATREASDLGLTNAALRQFAIGYAETHKK
jgi:uncharacterized protein (TIGR01244 family)